MQQQIQNLLNKIEKTYNIQILYACESGSRGWGFPSPDSDYDVRFIYCHEKNWYLNLFEKKDTIEFFENEDLDAGGWDLRKCLRLIHQSNAVIHEWLSSPIVYRKNEVLSQPLKRLAKACFLPKSALFHYLGTTNKTLHKSFKEDRVKIKKYFYVLRPVLAARWIRTYSTPPPMDFHQLLPLIENEKETLEAIHNLLKKKETAKEGELIEKIKILDEFVNKEMSLSGAYAQNLPKVRNQEHLVNEFYRKFLLQ